MTRSRAASEARDSGEAVRPAEGGSPEDRRALGDGRSANAEDDDGDDDRESLRKSRAFVETVGSLGDDGSLDGADCKGEGERKSKSSRSVPGGTGERDGECAGDRTSRRPGGACG